MSKKSKQVDSPLPAPTLDPVTLSALRNPLRQHIMSVSIEAKETGGCVSPKQLSEALGQNLSRVSYHVACLVRVGLLKLCGEEQRRGAMAHFYQPTCDTLLPGS